MPLPQAGFEGQRLNGNPDLRRPSVSALLGRRLPDAVPFGVVALPARVDERVITGARRVHREHVAGTPIEERAQHDAQVVFGGQQSVTAHAVADDRGSRGLVTFDANDDRFRPREHAHPRRCRWRGALPRINLGEVVGQGGQCPSHLVEPAVDHEISGQRSDRESRSSRRRGCSDHKWKREQPDGRENASTTGDHGGQGETPIRPVARTDRVPPAHYDSIH